MKANGLKAVALSYPKEADAPLIQAKESGFLAERMLEIAKENHIPVVKNPELTNVLSMAQIGECIPAETWKAVAAVFAYIAQSEGWKQKDGISE